MDRVAAPERVGMDRGGHEVRPCHERRWANAHAADMHCALYGNGIATSLPLCSISSCVKIISVFIGIATE
jgi:hypothetical protein